MTAWRWCVVGLFMLVGGLLAVGEVRSAGLSVMGIGAGFALGSWVVGR